MTTDTEQWIEVVANGATPVAHPDTVALLAQDDPRIAAMVTPDVRVKPGEIMAIKKYAPPAPPELDPQRTETIPPGLYRIFWHDGGASLGAIGRGRGGHRWLACSDWEGADPVSFTHWGKIKSLTLIARS